MKEEDSPFQITISQPSSLACADCRVCRELSFQHHSQADLLHPGSPGASVETLLRPGQVRRDKVEEALGCFSKRLLCKWYQVNFGCQLEDLESPADKPVDLAVRNDQVSLWACLEWSC